MLLSCLEGIVPKKNTPLSTSSKSSILASLRIEMKKILWCSKQCTVNGDAKDITQSVVDHIMAAATEAYDEVLKIALLPASGLC